MKYRYVIPGCTILILTACNFTMAADITPPPNYVPANPDRTTLIVVPGAGDRA